jgi:hypothetical protein
MPVNINKGESENEFISRCIGEEVSAGKEQDQAAAICYSYWRKDKMSKIKDTSAKVMAKVAYDTDFRGINLFADLEDACWEGYIAIGLKPMGDIMVPNCVPIDEEMSKIESEKNIELADYPWDECIADQTARYGDEETAKKVCGYIKSTSGGE